MKALVAAAILLLGAHLASYSVQPFVSQSYANTLGGLFNLSRENNFPTFFSALLLLLAALLLYGVHVVEKAKRSPWQRHWWWLSAILAFLSIDEAVQIHERLGAISGQLTSRLQIDVFSFAWVIPYTVLFLIVSAFFIRFVLQLPVRTRNLFIVAGILYVGGALGFEFIEGAEVSNHGFSFVYWLLVTVEEVMEMSGVLVLIYALLKFLQQAKAGFSLQA